MNNSRRMNKFLSSCKKNNVQYFEHTSKDLNMKFRFFGKIKSKKVKQKNKNKNKNI